MKLLILGVTLAVCRELVGGKHYTTRQTADILRLATKNFTSEVAAVLGRNWYVPKVAHYGNNEALKYFNKRAKIIRENTTAVFQFGPIDTNTTTHQSVLVVKHGYGLKRGKMTQFKFSFIRERETEECIVGMVPEVYLSAANQGLALNLKTGRLIEGNQEIFVSGVGKESDDLDWFIEVHDDEHVEVYMTLNGEPLGMAYRLSIDGEDSKKMSKRLRPYIVCNFPKTENNTNSANVIAVTQYEDMKIPIYRPYAASRQPDLINFEYNVPFYESVTRVFGRDYRLAVHVKLIDNKLEFAGLIERHRCSPSYFCRPFDHEQVAEDDEIKRDLAKEYTDYLKNGTTYRIFAGNLILKNDFYGDLTFKSLRVEPVETDMFTDGAIKQLIMHENLSFINNKMYVNGHLI